MDAIGDGVTGVAVGDRVFGMVDWAEHTSAGAADRAIMETWFAVPDGLDLTRASPLTMALSTAHWFCRGAELGFASAGIDSQG